VEIDGGKPFNIDYGSFDSNFVTTGGGISVPSGKKMSSSSFVAFQSGAIYTLYFTLGNYIPSGGILVVDLPTETPFDGIGNPYDDFFTDAPNLIKGSEYKNIAGGRPYIKFLAGNKVPAG
jgi:hypothetical protein